MKKFLSILLALALVLSLGTVAFAVEGDNSYVNYQDIEPIIKKTYQVNSGEAPAETFTYKFTPVSWTNNDGVAGEVNQMPEIANVQIVYEEAISTTTEKSVEVPINIENYELGIYKYEVTETASNTAGVTYSDEKLFLVLSVVRDEESNKHYVAALHYENENGSKTDNDLTNVYDSGSLKVTKQIEGNMADMDKKFAFTITFNAGSKTFLSEIESDNMNGKWNDETLTYTVSLGDNESVTLSNIPAGVTYTVEEDAENYESEIAYGDQADTHTISADDQDTVTVTNTLSQPIDTGVFMDSLPYVLLLVGACAGLVVFFARRRMTHKG